MLVFREGAREYEMAEEHARSRNREPPRERFPAADTLRYLLSREETTRDAATVEATLARAAEIDPGHSFHALVRAWWRANPSFSRSGIDMGGLLSGDLRERKIRTCDPRDIGPEDMEFWWDLERQRIMLMHFNGRIIFRPFFDLAIGDLRLEPLPYAYGFLGK